MKKWRCISPPSMSAFPHHPSLCGAVSRKVIEIAHLWKAFLKALILSFHMSHLWANYLEFLRCYNPILMRKKSQNSSFSENQYFGSRNPQKSRKNLFPNFFRLFTTKYVRKSGSWPSPSTIVVSEQATLNAVQRG